MKYLYGLYLVICLVSCKAKNKIKPINTKGVSIVNCPENGVCSLEVYKNKTLQIKTDNLGMSYPEMSNGNYLVLKFEYKKNENPNYVDGGYREEVFMELNPVNLEIETTNLQNEKLFFARWCYCKGQTGYYKINQGKLSVVKVDNENLKISLNFKIEEVPQIINEINQIIILQ
ncbi:hypothetical protein [Wocania ichthyoenteri]|uniref:hypothetical protein n=1 Tax=Wocania ichthyoenteri TaxID=1230531 RepID=UPI00053E6CD6|nr:hypothetical protein [Wocania ichthyoenteri]